MLDLMREKKDDTLKRAELAAEGQESFLNAKSLTKNNKGGKAKFWTDRTKNTNRQSVGSWANGQLKVSKSKIRAISATKR